MTSFFRTLGTRQGIALLTMLLILALVPPVALALDSPYYVRLAARILIFAIAAVSLDVLIGVCGMVALGHAVFMGLAAYFVAILASHAVAGTPVLAWPIPIWGAVDAWIVWPVVVGLVSLIAAGIGAIALRTRGLYFIMITLALGEMFYHLFLSLQVYGADEGMRLVRRSIVPGLDLRDRVHLYYLSFVILCATLWICWRVTYSPFGLVLRSARLNERRTRAIGLNLYPYQLACFIFSGAIAAISGILLVNNEAFVTPNDLSWVRSADLAIMVILGGTGSLFGPVLGAIAVVVIELFLEDMTTHWKFIWGPILMAIVLFARSGLWGLLVGSDKRGSGHG